MMKFNLHFDWKKEKMRIVSSVKRKQAKVHCPNELCLPWSSTAIFAAEMKQLEVLCLSSEMRASPCALSGRALAGEGYGGDSHTPLHASQMII